MPKDYSGKEPIGWFTVKGVHIPIFEGETRDDAFNRLEKESEKALPKKGFKTFRAVDGVEKETHEFFDDNNNSNAKVWRDELTPNQKSALMRYTGTDDVYAINKALYNGNTDSLSANQKAVMKNLDESLDNFSLYQGITTTRKTDMQILGFGKNDKPTKQQIIEKLQGTYGYLEYPAFLSSGVDNEGVAANADDITVHIQVPPSRGAGAYIADKQTSHFVEENEFLFARNAVLKYDLSSLKGKKGQWEITARWVGKTE